MAGAALTQLLPDRLAATLQQPVVRRETHAAWVLLSGDRALKLRKPVRLPFLDYSTRERRYAAAMEEVRVNAPLAAGVYRGVRALVEGADGLELGPFGWHDEAVDHVVEMLRFDERRTMAALLRDGRLTSEQVDAAGRRLAAFHAEAQRCGIAGAEPFARRAAADLDELDERLAPVAALRHYADAALARRGADLDRRAARGLRRDGHGDLRAEHVVFEDELLIVDRLEFDPELRSADVAGDLAFLTMDLEALGGRWAAERLVRAYVGAGGDAGDPRLRALLAWQRAIVRVKVALLRCDRDEARALLELAERLAWRERAPAVLVVGGPPASGKSTLAGELARRAGVPRVSSDVVRKELHGVPATERLPVGAYSDDTTRRVYRELGRRTARAVAERGGVVVDATARTAELRGLLLDPLAAAGEVVHVTCALPDHLRLARAEARLAYGQRISDAGPEVAARLGASFEPPGDAVLVHTGGTVEQAVAEAAAALDRRETPTSG